MRGAETITIATILMLAVSVAMAFLAYTFLAGTQTEIQPHKTPQAKVFSTKIEGISKSGITIRNDSNESTTANLYINGTYCQTVTLVPGVQVYDINCPVDLTGDVKVMLTGEGLMVEQTANLAEKPDLTVSTTVDLTKTSIGTPITMKIIVKNKGSDANGVNLKIYEGSTDINTINIGDLNSGQSTELTQKITFSQVGLKKVCAFVDYNNDIAETDENNNISCQTVNVTAILIGWQFKRDINITADVNYGQIPIEFNPVGFDFTKTKTNGLDVYFVDENNEIIPSWIDYWNYPIRDHTFVQDITLTSTYSFDQQNYAVAINPTFRSGMKLSYANVTFTDQDGNELKMWQETWTPKLDNNYRLIANITGSGENKRVKLDLNSSNFDFTKTDGTELRTYIENDSTFYDTSGNYHHAIGTAQRKPGKVGASASFSNNYLKIENKSDLNTSTFTILLWVYAQENTHEIILEKGYWNNGWVENQYTIEVNNGKVAFYVGTNGIETSIDFNKWVFVSATFDGSTMKLYINGIEKASGTSTAVSNTRDIWLGKQSTSPDLSFKGFIDGLKMYNRALTSEEIFSIMQDQAVSSGLILDINFDQTWGETKYYVANWSEAINNGDKSLPITFSGSGEFTKAYTQLNTWVDLRTAQLAASKPDYAFDSISGWTGKITGTKKTGHTKSGVDGNVEIPNHPSFNINGKTECIYINPTSSSSKNPIIYKQGSYELYLDSSNIPTFVTYQKDGNIHTTVAGSSVSLNQWTELCITYGDYVKLYQNGTLASQSNTKTGTLYNSVNSILLGTDGTNQFQGTFDTYVVYEGYDKPSGIAKIHEYTFDTEKGPIALETVFNPENDLNSFTKYRIASLQSKYELYDWVYPLKIDFTTGKTDKTDIRVAVKEEGFILDKKGKSNGKLIGELLPGKRTKALYGLARVKSTSQIELTSPITITAWIKTKPKPSTGNYSSDQMIISKGTDYFMNIYGPDRGSDSGKVNAGFGSTTVTSTTKVDDGNWHHIALTYDSSTIKLYIDGVLEASSAQSITINKSSSYLDIGHSSFDKNSEGLIDSVYIYNRALSGAEIVNSSQQNPPNDYVAGYEFNSDIQKVPQFIKDDTVWFVIPYINSSKPLAVYLFYGNSAAQDVSDSSILTFYEDFSTDPNTNGNWRIYGRNDPTNEGVWSGNQYYLTKAAQSKSLAMFAAKDINSDLGVYISFWENIGTGADGLAVGLYKNEQPYIDNNNPSTGGSMGTYSTTQSQGYLVEFDIYRNNTEPITPHIAVNQTYTSTDIISHDHISTRYINFTGSDHHIEIGMDKDENLLRLYYDNKLKISTNRINKFDYNGFGFSASTGGSYADQIIKKHVIIVPYTYMHEKISGEKTNKQVIAAMLPDLPLTTSLQYGYSDQPSTDVKIPESGLFIEDYELKSHDQTIQTTNKPKYVDGEYDKAVELTKGAYITIDDSKIPDLSDLSLFLDVKITNEQKFVHWLTLKDQSFGIKLGWGNKAKGYVYVDGAWRSTNWVQLTPNAWQKIGITYDRSSHVLKFYVDGNTADSVTLTGLSTYEINKSTYPLIIQGGNQIKSRYFEELSATNFKGFGWGDPQGRRVYLERAYVYNGIKIMQNITANEGTLTTMPTATIWVLLPDVNDTNILLYFGNNALSSKSDSSILSYTEATPTIQYSEVEPLEGQKLWVKTNLKARSSTKIKMYYGGTYSDSNGFAVFPIFDNFSTLHLKNNNATYSLQSGKIRMWGNANGNNSYLYSDVNIANAEIQARTNLLSDVGDLDLIFIARKQALDGNFNSNSYYAVLDREGTLYDYQKTRWEKNAPLSILKATQPYQQKGWVKFIARVKDSDLTITSPINTSITDNSYSSGYYGLACDNDQSSSSDKDCIVDWFFVRKYESDPQVSISAPSSIGGKIWIKTYLNKQIKMLYGNENAENDNNYKAVFDKVIKANKTQAGGNWKDVLKTINNSVIFASPSYNDSAPGVVRIINPSPTTASSFMLRFEEYKGSDMTHFPEDIYYIEAQKGDWIINGTRVQIGSLNVQNTGNDADKTKIDYNTTASTPIVITQINTANDSDEGSHTRVSSVGTNNANVIIEEKTDNSPHYEEAVGYMIIQKGTYTSRLNKSIVSGIVDVNSDWATISYSGITTPIVVAKIDSENETDNASERLQSVAQTSASVKVEETPAFDGTHADENVGWIALDSGDYYGAKYIGNYSVTIGEEQ